VGGSYCPRMMVVILFTQILSLVEDRSMISPSKPFEARDKTYIPSRDSSTLNDQNQISLRTYPRILGRCGEDIPFY